MNFHGKGKQCGCNPSESAAEPSRYNAKKRVLPSAAASIDSKVKHTGKNPEPWHRSTGGLDADFSIFKRSANQTLMVD
jgi:hypothetical protein